MPRDICNETMRVGNARMKPGLDRKSGTPRGICNNTMGAPYLPTLFVGRCGKRDPLSLVFQSHDVAGRQVENRMKPVEPSV
jgi:hypothetical protein